jgi:hypothetical protein
LLEEATSRHQSFVSIEEVVETLKQEPCLSEGERRNVGEEGEELSVRHSLVIENCQAKKTL